MLDAYGPYSLVNTIPPVSGISPILTGVAVSTSAYDGVIGFACTFSPITTQTASFKIQASGTGGWSDITGRTASIVSGNTSSYLYADSRDGINLRPILNVTGTLTAGVVAVGPLKIV